MIVTDKGEDFARCMAEIENDFDEVTIIWIFDIPGERTKRRYVYRL